MTKIRLSFISAVFIQPSSFLLTNFDPHWSSINFYRFYALTVSTLGCVLHFVSYQIIMPFLIKAVHEQPLQIRSKHYNLCFFHRTLCKCTTIIYYLLDFFSVSLRKRFMTVGAICVLFIIGSLATIKWIRREVEFAMGLKKLKQFSLSRYRSVLGSSRISEVDKAEAWMWHVLKIVTNRNHLQEMNLRRLHRKNLTVNGLRHKHTESWRIDCIFSHVGNRKLLKFWSSSWYSILKILSKVDISVHVYVIYFSKT